MVDVVRNAGGETGQKVEEAFVKRTNECGRTRHVELHLFTRALSSTWPYQTALCSEI
jgi:hypothetical protein